MYPNVLLSYSHSHSTILVEPACVATVTKYGDIQIQVGTALSRKIGTELEAIQLSIFSHRFMSSAEQMGRSSFVVALLYIFLFVYCVVSSHIRSIL